MDPVSLLDWFAAVACDAATFGRDDAAFIAREVCQKARDAGGLRVELAAIGLLDDGSVTLTNPEACDEKASARSIRRVLDELLQRAPDSTPALRLCAARFEDTTLELLAKDLEFAGGPLDRMARRAAIASAVATVRVSMRDGAFRAPAIPAPPPSAPLSTGAMPVPGSLPGALPGLPTSTLLAMAPPLAMPGGLLDPNVERLRAQLAASELERTRLASSLTMYGDALREAQGRLQLATAEIEGSRGEAEALRRAAHEVEQRLHREIEAREAQRVAQLESEQGRRVAHETQTRAVEDEARRRREVEARLAALERALTEATARAADAEARAEGAHEGRARAEEIEARANAELAALRADKTALTQEIERAREKASRLEREVTRQAERAGATRTLPLTEHEEALAALARDKDEASRVALAALRSQHEEALAALAREQMSRATAHEDAVAARDRQRQELEFSVAEERRRTETAKADLEAQKARVRALEARLEAQETEATQRLARTEQAAAERLEELSREHARLLEQETVRAERALDAERKEHARREAERDERHKAELARIVGGVEAGSAESVAALEAAHQRALDAAKKQHAEALAEASHLATQQKAALDKVIAELRGRLDKAELTARSELLRARDGWNAEAEQRHTRELGAALQKLRVTLEEEAGKARAEERYNHTAALAAQRAEGDALLAALRKERDELEQSLFRALADRDAERQLRLDVESKAARNDRELRRRSLASPEQDLPPAPVAPLPAKAAPAAPKEAAQEAARGAERVDESPEPPEASVPPTPLPDRVRKAWKGGKLGSLLGYGGLGLLGGLTIFAVVRMASPLLAPEAPLPPPPKPAAAGAGSSVAMAPPSSCQAALELDNVVKGSEILRRVGRAPVSFVAPMRTPLELVVTHEGYVPKRITVAADADWAVDGPSPHLTVKAAMEGNAVASTGSTGFEGFPRTDRHAPPSSDGVRGLLTVEATPAGADLWLSVDPKQLHDLPCGAPVELLVVGPLGTVRKERVEWSAFHGAPPTAKLKL